MELYQELLSQEIGRYILDRLNDANIFDERVVESKSIQALNEIRDVIHYPDLNDFEIVDQITCIFVKYGIDPGECHDL